MLGSLKTTSFKETYALSKPWPKWLRFLFLGLLVWIEERWITIHVEETVDEAIKEVEPHLPPSGVPKPIYSETGGGFYDEMRLTAPWKAREGTSDSPQV